MSAFVPANARVFLASAVVAMALAGCQQLPPAETDPEPSPVESITFAPALDIDLSKFTKTRAGAWYRDMVPGTGTTAAIDRSVTVRYVIYLPDGKLVQSQIDPIAVTLGPDVIRGWRDGIPGMKVGGMRRLVVPPELGYGKSAHGSIPPQSTLIFEIELLGVR